MKVNKTPIEGLFIIESDVFEDQRGYFYEAFNKKKYEEIGIHDEFVQDNISKSAYGTIRGLHYQVGEHAQSKLCRAIKGRVLDVALDIRFGSPTFGLYYSVELSEENKKQIWIPEGFAHGFSVLSCEAVFSYKTGNYYSKESERTICYDDPDLNIDWLVPNPIVSDKDKAGKKFKEINKDFFYKK